MMQRAAAIAIGTAVLTTSLGVRADPKVVDEKFCAAAASFQTDVATLNAINDRSTVGELRAARRRIDKDVDQMRMAAHFMSTPTAKQFLEAMSRVDDDVNRVPDDATLRQVRTRIETDVQDAQSTGRQLATEAGCPQPSQ